MSTGYFYRLYGLRVASQLPLAELAQWSGGTAHEADVRIELGPLPPAVRRAISEADGTWIGTTGAGDFWLASPGGHYYIANGNTIRVDGQTAVDELNTRLFLLGSAFGILLIQRGLMPVHGSAVLRGGHAVVISGATGAGKSTVCSAILRQEGVGFLADDVAALALGAGGIMVQPAYPQRKLCRDAALALQYDLSTLQPLHTQPGQREKYAVRSAAGWRSEPAPLGAIVELVPRQGSEGVRLVRISGHEGLRLVMRNLYRPYVHFMQGMPPQRMKKCLQIAASVPLYQLLRPARGNHVDEMVTHILRLL